MYVSENGGKKKKISILFSKTKAQLEKDNKKFHLIINYSINNDMTDRPPNSNTSLNLHINKGNNIKLDSRIITRNNNCVRFNLFWLFV